MQQKARKLFFLPNFIFSAVFLEIFSFDQTCENYVDNNKKREMKIIP